MPGPIAAAGAISNPTRYATLNMGAEQFSGMSTQRSPFRDAFTAYLVRKFYQGSRFDSILDGLNREIGSKLTDVRRPGSAVYNANNCPPAYSYFAWKYIQSSQEVISVLADCTDGTIRDVTAGQLSTLMTKAAGAGRARFLGIGRELFLGDDGVEQQKILTGSTTWGAATNIPPGTLIQDTNGNLQMALGGLSLPIVATASTGTHVRIWIDPEQVPAQFPNLNSASVTFGGLTTATYLNGLTSSSVVVISTTLGILEISLSHATYAYTLDTGSGSTGNGTTGGSAPVFSATEFHVTADAGQQWKCYGARLQNWGIAGPTKAPTITPLNGARWWQPNFNTSGGNYAIRDSNGNIQVGTAGTTGTSYPQWAGLSSTTIALTSDNTVTWLNWGPPGSWASSTAFGNIGQTAVIVDSNGNLQLVTNGNGGNSGGSVPTWNATLYGTTTDGALTWTNLGPGVTLTTASTQYAFSFHGVDGSVSTASPAAYVQGPVLGQGGNTYALTPYLQLNATAGFSYDSQVDQFWVWRTAQGQATLLLEDQLPADHPLLSFFTFTFDEYGIADASTFGNGALDAFIPAPVASSNNPPPAGLTGPVEHLQRVWGFVGNIVYYSGGPDTITGNGFTAWPPLNQIIYPGQVIRLEAITVDNGGLLVFTTSGVFIVLGLGTASNPFYSTQWCKKINLASYDTFDVYGTEIFMMESNGKVSSLVIEYPFNPQSGYTEIGFPIGDQFNKVTTGGFNATLFTPATCSLSWNVHGTGESAMYVADGGGHWFRLSQVSPPEQGFLWSPIAAIAGGSSAIQSVETSPGVYDLLIGPAASGPILKRDTTGAIFKDNGTAYPAWDAKGVNQLCTTGQWTEVAHISAKSAAVGSRPTVSVLLGEIAPSTKRPWTVLEVTSPDPADTPRSESYFSDRYALAQNGVAMTGDCILTKFDYGSQAVADELLDWGIYGSTEDERKEEAQK